MEVAVEQAQSYLASINALTLMKGENAWFAHATAEEEPSRTAGSSLTHYMPDEAYSQRVRPIRVVSVDDVRREYTLALARLELVKRYPDLAYATTVLRPVDAVLLFVNSESFDSAFNVAWTLGVDMTPIFGALTDRAVALTLAKSQRNAVTQLDAECIARSARSRSLTKRPSPTVPLPHAFRKIRLWTGPASDRAWRFLRYHLEMYPEARYYKTVLSKACHSSIPDWLIEWFRRNGNMDILLRVYIDHSQVIEAGREAIAWLKEVTKQVGRMGRAHEGAFRITLSRRCWLISTATLPRWCRAGKRRGRRWQRSSSRQGGRM